ncbi:MAG: hypothetical protein MZV64_20125 [Ignavibacteriales bacterium]|nr:hypothetical protein [Ignavibacteriales bacterium]
MLGQKLNIVSDKPQPREEKFGILTGETYQIIFVDTLTSKPNYLLHERMMEAVEASQTLGMLFY